jgi:glucosamine-6-phosphate deaminase
VEVIIQPIAELAAGMAARLFTHLIRTKPNAILGLASGGTPVPLSNQLIQQNLDWSQITSFNLDEYIGVGADHPQSYHAFMHENLFRHVNINKANIHIPDGMAADPETFCRNYEDKIAAAGGIGSDGHIGFNEPTSSLASRTRIKTLTARTRKDNARFFGSEDAVPLHAITMGIGTILDTRKTVLLATGKNKACRRSLKMHHSRSLQNAPLFDGMKSPFGSAGKRAQSGDVKRPKSEQTNHHFRTPRQRLVAEAYCP